MSDIDTNPTNKIEEQSPFEITSDTERTRSDRYYRSLDGYVIAPAKIIWEDTRTRIGILIISAYLLMGTVGVMMTTPPEANEGPRLLVPLEDLAFPLGTDATGTDILASIIHATPAMLKMVLAGAVFATVIATVVGTIAGYKGGVSDLVLMYITDVMMSLPGLPLIVVLSVLLEPKDPYFVGIILAVNRWAGLARSIRSQILTLRENEYVEASRVLGINTVSIIRDDLLPSIMPYVLINFMSASRVIIFSSVGLYFLGLLPISELNWGVIMNLAYSRGALHDPAYLHWLVIPMVTIILFALGQVLIAQGMDRLFNPQVRAKHAKTIETDDGKS